MADSGRKAKIIDPAAVTAPWLARDGAGNLAFWAPARGVTTFHSDHPRTELDSRTEFRAGSSIHNLRASLSVTQLPDKSKKIIVGQMHGAGSISSVPFVMVVYDSGALDVVVKQKQSGSEGNRDSLLSNVPLGATFDYKITDNGDGSLRFTATYGSTTNMRKVALPASFSDAAVRFQAGDYQQDDVDEDPSDSGRVVFTALSAD